MEFKSSSESISRRITKYVRCWLEIVRCVTVANLNLIWYTIGSQCNCVGSGSDDEKRDVLSTKRAQQPCTRCSLDKFKLGNVIKKGITIVQSTELVDRSTGAEPSLKSHADHSVRNSGVVLAGDDFRRSEAGDPAYIP